MACQYWKHWTLICISVCSINVFSTISHAYPSEVDYEAIDDPDSYHELIHLPEISHLTITTILDLVGYIQVKKVVTLRIIGDDPEEWPDSKQRDLYYRTGQNPTMLIEDIPSVDTIESLEIVGITLDPLDYERTQFPRLRILKLYPKLDHHSDGDLELFSTPCLEDLTLTRYDWQGLARDNHGPNYGYLFGPLSLKHLELNQTSGYLDITIHCLIQPNLLTLKMTGCKLGKSFLRSLSNVDGRSLEILPVLELIEMRNCTWDYHRYRPTQFIGDCAVGRPNARVIVEV